MQINRHTYEEFFLLYADNELSTSEKKSVEEFVEQNPDLADEFSLMLETVMQPDESIIFENKELLLKEEEDDRKVIPMRWFRFAVAAILLIAFSVVGWVFFGERKNTPPMALNNKQVPVIVNKQPSSEIGKPSEDVKTTTSSGKDVTEAEPGKLKSSKNYARNFKSNLVNNSEKTPVVVVQEEPGDVEPAANQRAHVPDHTTITQDVAETIEKKIIDITVAPREMDAEQEPASNATTYAQSFDQQENNSDLIYFANTSLTKKTKLRGVLRKATRYLDRVTSLQ